MMLLALAAVVAWSGAALARDAEKKKKKDGGKGETVTGTLTEAKVDGETVTWKVKVTGEDDPQELPMSTNVVAMYGEKDGVNRVMMIRVAGKKTPESKGKRLVAAGTLTKVEIADNLATITIGETKVVLPTAVKVMVREKGGTKQALMIGPAGKDRGERKPKGEGQKKGGRKKKGGDAVPENL